MCRARQKDGLRREYITEHIGKKVTVFGSFVVGLMDGTPHLSAAGEMVKRTVFEMRPGGKGLNQGVAARKAGADVTMVTKLGQDMFTDIALNTMNELHMDTGRVLYSETTETGCVLIMVDENSNQDEIVIILGACDTITDREVNSLEDLVGQPECLLIQLETDVSSVERVVDTAHGRGVKVILDAAPVQPVSNELLGKIDLITPNEVEAEILTDVRVDSEEAANKAADWFFSKGVKNVLITPDQRGVYINTGEKKGIIPAYRVGAVDTIGIEGVFSGSLLAALAEGKNLQEAADFVNALVALSVQKISTTPSIPVREEIDAFMAADHQTMDGWRKTLQYGNYQGAITRIRTKRTAIKKLQSVEL